MSYLEYLLKNVHESVGIYRLGALDLLREYVRKKKENEIIEEIKKIKDVDLLSYIQAVGVSWRITQAIVKRAEELVR